MSTWLFVTGYATLLAAFVLIVLLSTLDPGPQRNRKIVYWWFLFTLTAGALFTIGILTNGYLKKHGDPAAVGGCRDTAHLDAQQITDLSTRAVGA